MKESQTKLTKNATIRQETSLCGHERPRNGVEARGCTVSPPSIQAGSWTTAKTIFWIEIAARSAVFHLQLFFSASRRLSNHALIGRSGAAGAPLPLDSELPLFHELFSLSSPKVYALAQPPGDRPHLGALAVLLSLLKRSAETRKEKRLHVLTRFLFTKPNYSSKRLRSISCLLHFFLEYE